MSIVLWANVLESGKVVSDESDKYVLYRHEKKLDKLTSQLGVTGFSSTLDFTDSRFNLSTDDLPEGMSSTYELMAEQGTWVSGEDAVEMLEKLIGHIAGNKIKFGILGNDRDDVIRELEESLDFAKRARAGNGMFNFSVVM